MPRVPVATLWQRLTQGQVDTLYFLCGEETYLIQEYTTTLIERILGAAPRDFNCDVFSAESDALADVLSVARTLPMMAAYRVVVYHGLEQLPKADWPHSGGLSRTAFREHRFICSSSESEPKKCSPRLWQHATTVVCTGLKVPGCTSGWHKRSLQPAIVSPRRLFRAYSRIRKPICTPRARAGKTLYVCGGLGRDQPPRRPCGQPGLTAAFRVCPGGCPGTRHSATALVEIDHLLNQGEPPLVILSMIVRHLRLLWSVQQLTQQRHDLPRIAKTLRVPLTVCRQVAAQSRAFSSERLLQLYTVAWRLTWLSRAVTNPPRPSWRDWSSRLCPHLRAAYGPLVSIVQC